MNRREFLGVTTVSGIGLLAGSGVSLSSAEALEKACTKAVGTSLKLLPYPQQVTLDAGSLRLGKATFQAKLPNSKATSTAIASLNGYGPSSLAVILTHANFVSTTISAWQQAKGTDGLLCWSRTELRTPSSP